MQNKPESIDQYLSTLSEPRRSTLQKLRQIIHSKAPGVVECISYSMPAFRLDGDVIAGFLATTKGCSYYPFSGSALSGLTAELAGYGGTTSAVHFAADQCLPAKLVGLLLKARTAEAEMRRTAKSSRKKATVKKTKAKKAAAKKTTAKKASAKSPANKKATKRAVSKTTRGKRTTQ